MSSPFSIWNTRSFFMRELCLINRTLPELLAFRVCGEAILTRLTVVDYSPTCQHEDSATQERRFRLHMVEAPSNIFRLLATELSARVFERTLITIQPLRA